jgi:hypothetical protein
MVAGPLRGSAAHAGVGDALKHVLLLLRSGCAAGAPLRRLVDGQPIRDAVVNDRGAHESFDLTLS